MTNRSNHVAKPRARGIVPISRFACLFPCLFSCLVLAACGQDPDVAKVEYLAAGNEYAEQENYAEAIIAYRNAIQQDERFGEARLKLAEAYLRVNNPAAAYGEYIRAADLLPDDVDAQVQAGAILLAAGQIEDAASRARAAIRLDPENVDAHILLGNATVGLEDLEGAVGQMEAAIELDPGQARSYASLGAVQMMRGDRDQAEAAFLKAVEVEPEATTAHLALANFYWSAGRLEDTEDSLLSALGMEPTNALANRALATFYLAGGRAADAEPYLVALADQTDAPGPQLGLADYYLAVERTDEAVTILEGLADHDDALARVPARTRLAAIDYAEGRTDEAHDAIDALIESNADAVQAHVLKGRFLIAERQIDEAVKVLDEAVSADPASVVAHYALGTVYAQRYDYEQAIGSFNEVLRLNPRAIAAQLQLARLHLATGDAETSVQLSESVLAEQPDHPVSRLVLAQSLMGSQQLDRAESELDRLVEEFPQVALVHVQLGTLHSLRQDLDAATRAFEEALLLDGSSLEALGGLVLVDLASGRVEMARARVTPRLNQAPSEPGLLMLDARVAAAEGDLARTERSLRRTIEVNLSELQAYGFLGQVYFAQGKLDQAKSEFEAIARRQPDSVSAPTVVGMIFEVQNKIPEAKAQYEQVLEIDSRAAVAANNLAWHYAEAGDNLERALQLARVAKDELPDRHEVNDTLGWVYYKRQLYTEAIPPLEESVEQAPDIASYRYHFGMAYVRAGDWTKGREALLQALKLDPGFDGSADARDTLSTIGN